MFLSNEEVIELTGCMTPKAQILWLKVNAIKHYVNADDTPVVVRSTVHNLPRRKVVPDLGTLKKREYTDMEINRVGVYCLMHRGSIVYIGKTKNLFSRISSHLTSGKQFDSVRFIPIKSELVDMMEMELIARHNPAYNVIGIKPAPQKF